MNKFKKFFVKIFGNKCVTCAGSGRIPFGRGNSLVCWKCNGVGKN